MAHSRDHSHDDSAYFTEQLCTLGISGAFGAIAVVLYATGGLNVLLAQGILRHSVLVGGIALLVLVLIRAATLWFAAGKVGAAHAHEHDCCDHEHEHEHHHDEHCDHDHEHAHDHSHGHSHGGDGHSHDHGWAPIRYVVLLIPVMLYFFVPLEALSAGGVGVDDFNPAVQLANSKGFMGTLGFRELDAAKDSEGQRQYYEGKIAQITGMLVPSPSDRWFTLQRLKIRCCAADAVPLNAVVLIDDSQVKDAPPEQPFKTQDLNRKWVEVTAQIQFQQGPKGWMPVLIVRPTPEIDVKKLIRQIPPDPDPYL
jgi:hypothetical protein